MSAISADQLALARSVRIEDELARRGVKLRGKVERTGPCPRCGGTDRFSINVRKQAWHCRGCKPLDVTGDVIGLVRWFDGCDFVAAVTLLAGKNESRPRRERQIDQPADVERGQHADVERAKLAERTWQEASALTSRALEYLQRRGISLEDVPENGGLRFHECCPWETATAPCIIARYTDAATNEPRGIWRRPISGVKPRTLGPMAGCVIRLWPDEAIELGLVLGEGVETVLAAATRIEHHGTLLRPAWATGGTSNMITFPVLAGIEALTILVDNDANGAGQKAAAACAQRWRDAGREVIRLTPPNLGADFNDLALP